MYAKFPYVHFQSDNDLFADQPNFVFMYTQNYSASKRSTDKHILK